MTLTDPAPPHPPPPGPDGPPTPPAPLRRSSSNHLVAGVAGGVAERFDVDANIVRVAFVVAACLWGIGVVVYLAMWALVPSDGHVVASDGPDAPTDRPAPTSLLTYLLLAGALFLGLVIATAWWGGPRWGGSLGFGWLLVLLAAVVVALRRPSRFPSVGRVLLVLALIVLSAVILAVGTFFAAVATTGVPLTGGIGQRVVQPTTTAQLQPTYRLAVGSMTLDLTRVPFTAVPRTVTASVGVGQLVVDVPAGAVVAVRAQSSIGPVTYGAAGQASFEVPTGAVGPFGPPRPQLVIDAQVGIGQVRLLRDGS